MPHGDNDAPQSDDKGGSDVPVDHILKPFRIPIIGIFLILLLQSLVWASDFLIPVTAAVLGYFVFNKPRRWLQRLGVPSVITASLITLVVGVALVSLLVKLSGPTVTFLDDIPRMIEEIDRKLNAAGGAFQKINEATEAAEEVLGKTGTKSDTVEVEVVSRSGLLSTVVDYAPGILGQLIFAQLLLFFLIASGDLFVVKTVESFDQFKDKRKAVDVIRAIENRLGRYLGGIAAINAGLGVTIGVAMSLWGLPNAAVIGVMGFVLNFVPFLGGLLGSIVAASIAFLTLDGVWPALGVFATYMTLTSIEGQLLTPALISRRMKLNTPVVFLAVAFFAWIWSGIGMIVALPILIVVKIICDETGKFSTLGKFLSGVNEPEP